MAYINGKEIFFSFKKEEIKAEDLAITPKKTAQTFEPADGSYYKKVSVSAMNLSQLTVTENGTYTTGALEYGKEYTFKSAYTQEELKALAESSTLNDGAYDLYALGESWLAILPFEEYGIGFFVSDSERYMYITESVAEVLGGAAGWNFSSGGDYTPIDSPPFITFQEAGALYVSDLSVLSSLFNLQACDGFSSVVVNVKKGESGAGSLVPLSITENGVYYPPKGTVEIGGTYTFKTAYTQEELKRIFDVGEKSDDGLYSYLYRDNVRDNMLGVMFNDPFYGAYTSADGFIWLPEAFVSQIGGGEGWYRITDEGGFVEVEETPTFAFEQTGESFVDDMAIMDALFELPEAAVGFSSVVVNVAGAGDQPIEGAVLVTFLDYNGASLYSRHVFIGDDCESPVARGQIETPTRATDAQYVYTFSGWTSEAGGAASAAALSDISADRTVYAAYATEYVMYTVNWYDGETLMKTEKVRYGGTATPPDTKKDGYVFDGWGTEDFTIYGNTDFFGTWSEDTAYAVKMADPETLPTGAYSLSYSPDGTKFIVCCASKIYIYDATTEPYTFVSLVDVPSDKYSKSGALRAAFIDNTHYVSAYATAKGVLTLRVFDITTGAETSNISITHPQLNVISLNYLALNFKVSKNGNVLVGQFYAESSYTHIVVIDINNSVLTSRFIHALTTYDIPTVTEDGSKVVLNTYIGGTYDRKFGVTVLDISGESAVDITDDIFASSYQTDALKPYQSTQYEIGCCSIDGTKYAVALNGYLYLHDAEAQSVPFVWPKKKISVNSNSTNPKPLMIAYSPNNRVVAHTDGANTSKKLCFYDVASGASMGDVEIDVAGTPSGGIYNADGTRFAIAHSSAPYFSIYKTKV